MTNAILTSNVKILLFNVTRVESLELELVEEHAPSCH